MVGLPCGRWLVERACGLASWDRQWCSWMLVEAIEKWALVEPLVGRRIPLVEL